MKNEEALDTIYDAVRYLQSLPLTIDNTDAIELLLEGFKAVGPLGQIPSWERNQ